MFTPQKKLWPLTPRTESGKKKRPLSGQASGSNTSVRNAEALAINEGMHFIEGDGNMDRDVLSRRVSKLENELIDYQYNMGLLLIEKKEWTLKCEEMRQALEEMTDSLQRERRVHLNELSEMGRQEGAMRKALDGERHCVLDLEKALQEIRSENADIKLSADKKLAGAKALGTSIDEKSLEAEAKFHAADAKLAEANKKNSEIERKFLELEAQENALQKEQSFFATQREVHDSSIFKQKEDLQLWEQKLQAAEEKLAGSRRVLNEQEDRASANDIILIDRKNELEELQKKIDTANSALKNKEDDISSRLACASLKEKEADDVRGRLEDKEKELMELEEKLSAREKLEIQKMLDEHKIGLAEKEKEFELEMEQKRKLHDEQWESKLLEVENKEVEISRMEEKVKKREKAIETKVEKARVKEKDLDAKSKALKEREKSVKIEEKNLEKDRKQILAEKEDLLNAKTELETLKTDSEKLLLRLSEEREQMKVSEEERIQLSCLQSELKEEIDKCRSQREHLMKEAEDLKQEKENFEKEWEELDDKRGEIKKEEQSVLEQKRQLEKLRQSEEEKLGNEKLETELYVQRELEALKLAKDSFSEKMDHEKSLMAEISEREKIQMILDFEKKKQELEDEMQRKKEEIENHLLEKEKTFEQERENELNNINYLREIGRREMEEMKLERLGLETEKLEILQNKKYVEAQQSEIKRDIEELVGFSQKLKDQRDVFIEERLRFIAFTEKQANCNICGEAIREFILSDLKPSPELKKFEAPPLPSFAENYLKEAVEGRSAVESSPILDNSGSPSSGGTISWLRKCTSKIFKFSAGKKLELDYAQDSKQVAEPQPSTQVDHAEASLGSGDMEPQQTAQVVNDSVDVFKEVGAVQTLPVEQDPLNIPENTSSSSDKGVKTRETRKRSMKATVSGSKVNSEAANTKEESQAESDIVGTPRNKRKRDADQGSRVTASDNQTEGHSDIIKDGNRRKRRQKIIATEQSFGQKRYNLRHAKKSVGTDTDGSALQLGDRNDTEQLPSSEANQFDIGIGGDPNEAIHKTRSTDGDGNNDHPLQSTEVTSEFSDSRLKNAEGAISSRHGDIAYSEEMNRTAEGETDYNSQGFTTESLRKDDTEDDNDEVDHPGQVSIGKKLWTFITT